VTYPEAITGLQSLLTTTEGVASIADILVHTVICTDGLHPAHADRWPAYADAADARVPGFGRLAAWSDVPCASNTWTVSDEDAYRGPFTRRTADPVLIIGNYWDSGTNYDNAVAASELLPNNRLVSVDSWGHTAFTRSACLDKALENYLVTTAPPAGGTRCVGDYQPFMTRGDQGPSAGGSRQ
jgi:hypothetical protein